MYLRQPPGQTSIALNVARDRSRAAWFAVSTLVVASIASFTLLSKVTLPFMFNHDRYEISPSGMSQNLQNVSLQWGQAEVDDDSSPLLTKPVKTLQFLKPGADEEAAARLGEVGQYLWEVYERAPNKRDQSGDFTWKDPTSAERLGMSMPEYVIGGMDPDFREQLYHAGRAMDAAGIKWAILSAFRDDFRQGLASGYKARARNSLHGGSARTGGYGHGRAVDVTGDGEDGEAVWKWLDANRIKFGLYRPMPGVDPGHVQSRGEWRKLATAFRQARIKGVQEDGSINMSTTKTIASASR
jgi:hypothetical protein